MQNPKSRTYDLAVHCVVNGALDMSHGKVAAQVFQAGQRLFRMAQSNVELAERLERWEQLGTKTVVHIAETQHVFERVCREADGAVMIDEGINEVPEGSATVFATFPVSRQEAPKIIGHKRLRIWRPATQQLAACA